MGNCKESFLTLNAINNSTLALSLLCSCECWRVVQMTVAEGWRFCVVALALIENHRLEVLMNNLLN